MFIFLIIIDKEILIATTHMITGNYMIASLNERFDQEKDIISVI